MKMRRAYANTLHSIHPLNTLFKHYLNQVGQENYILLQIFLLLINNKYIILPDDIVIKYQLPSNKVDFETVINLFNLQCEFQSDLRLTPKLEEYKLHPTNFQKMKVKTSYHVLHPDV